MQTVNSTNKTEIVGIPWKTFDVVLGILVVLVSLVIMLAAYVAVSPDGVSQRGLIVLGLAIGGLLAAVSWVLGPFRHGAPLSSLGLKLPAPRSSFHLVLPVMVVLASLAFTAVYSALVSIVGWDAPTSLLDEIDLEGAASIGGFAFVGILWGPLAEEIFFRGFIFAGLAGRLGFPGAAVGSSVLFAVFHTDPRVMVPIFVTGLLLAWIYKRTGSLWGCFAAHAMQNTLAFGISVGG